MTWCVQEEHLPRKNIALIRITPPSKLNDRNPFSFGLPYMVMDWDGTWCQWALGLVDFHQVPLDQVVWGTIANEVWFEIVMQGVLNL